MADQYFKSSFKNIQYKKHKTRKHGVKFDRYFRGSYQVAGKRKAINFGWESEGWSESSVYEKINFYKKNAKTGKGPTSLKEERDLEEGKKAEKEKARLEAEKANLILTDFFYKIYYPQVKREKKEKTYLREESLYRNWIKPNLGGKTFKNISKADIESVFYEVVDSGKSVRTAEYALTTLKQIWREAGEGGYASAIPTVSKTMKKKISQNNNARNKFLSQDEAATLLAELKKTSIPLYEKAMISLHCGLRAGEIFNLTWSQVDLDHGILNIINSKGKDRSVQMTVKVKEVLSSKKKGVSHELVYPGREGKPSKQISQSFRTVANKLFNQGVTDRRERVTFHTLRHTCASWMVMKGISLYLVQKVLGHSTIQVTERYAHLAPDQLQLAANAIDMAVAEHKEKNIVPLKKKA